MVSLKQKLEKERVNLNSLEKLLESLNPTEIMKRGFCIARKNGKVIVNSRNLALKQQISLEFFKGRADAVVMKKTP